MDNITLKSKTADGNDLEAVFLREKGMALKSFRIGGKELISQESEEDFQSSFRGLGVLVGPHFQARNPKTIPETDLSSFPHVRVLKDSGSIDPFEEGIFRYAPWQVAEQKEGSLCAKLAGKDNFQGQALSSLEGQDFKASLDACLDKDGLHMRLGIVSDFDSLLGFQAYFNASGDDSLEAQVAPNCWIEGQDQQIPWSYEKASSKLNLNLSQKYDVCFHPVASATEGSFLLKNKQSSVKVKFGGPSGELCWQLSRDPQKPYVVLGPLGAYDPFKPQLSVSYLNLSLCPSLH